MRRSPPCFALSNTTYLQTTEDTTTFNMAHHWIYRVGKTNLSAHIYPNVDHHIINISIFDDRNPDQSELIKKWSGDLRMTR